MLVKNVTQALMSPSSEPICKCHERMGNDFWFLPMDKCLFSTGKCLDKAEFFGRASLDEIIDGATAPKDPLDPIRGGTLT
jgi:hypothetical protein